MDNARVAMSCMPLKLGCAEQSKIGARSAAAFLRMTGSCPTSTVHPQDAEARRVLQTGNTGTVCIWILAQGPVQKGGTLREKADVGCSAGLMM